MIVTISREYGAAGLAVADGVARALRYALLTDDLPRTVAARLGTSAHEVDARAGSQKSLTERMLVVLGAGTPEMLSPGGARPPHDFDETLREEIERTIRERAHGGDIVILGRNAGAVLGRRADVVRIFLRAERAWKVQRLVESFGIARDEASEEIDRVDCARRAFSRDRYKIAWGDGRFYDLLLDVSTFGIAGAVALIESAVRTLERGSA
ncbi:MAG: cytidylate kinase-like family protein [Candidatus Eremiobacteraeota bacterium]|nr:cytidylate kinase-like family protein [Candidatus Eremiobacteraeota bacterium]